EHGAALLGDLAHALRRLHAGRLQAQERLLRQVVAEHRLAALRRHVATDGLAHYAQPDEADHFASPPVKDYTHAPTFHPGPSRSPALVGLPLARVIALGVSWLLD